MSTATHCRCNRAARATIARTHPAPHPRRRRCHAKSRARVDTRAHGSAATPLRKQPDVGRPANERGCRHPLRQTCPASFSPRSLTSLNPTPAAIPIVITRQWTLGLHSKNSQSPPASGGRPPVWRCYGATKCNLVGGGGVSRYSGTLGDRPRGELCKIPKALLAK